MRDAKDEGEWRLRTEVLGRGTGNATSLHDVLRVGGPASTNAGLQHNIGLRN